MSKYEDTRIVTFKEDYGVQKLDKNGDPIIIDGKPAKIIYYKKGSQHAIHKNVVKKIEEKGGKIDVELFDRKAFVSREREKLLKKKDAQVSVERR